LKASKTPPNYTSLLINISLKRAPESIIKARLHVIGITVIDEVTLEEEERRLLELIKTV